MRRALTYTLMMMVLAGASIARGEDAFDPKGWTTCEKYPPIGDPKAKRDVKEPFVYVWQSFPPTLRTDGPNANLLENRMVYSLIYESLLQVHPETEEFIPYVADYWKIETDAKTNLQTFWFHIDPKAKFADGAPVTAEDVVASFWHCVQEDREDPTNVMIFREGFDDPVAVDAHTVKVKTRKQGWRLFLYFSNDVKIFPAKQIKIPGKQYLEEYNWKFITGSGPYKLASPEDVKKGDSVTLTRRGDWWAEKEPWAVGTYNFAKVKYSVVSEEELEYQMFKKGDLDVYFPTVAKRWVQDYPNEDVVKKGWVKRRKIFNKAPRGFGGLAFNMREKPFDDKRVRQAFCCLFNREKLIEKLFFNEYDFVNSYEPGRDWGNEAENPPTTYDPKTAAELLAQAGYKTRDADGFLIGPDGKRFEVTLTIPPIPSLERIFLVVKEDFQKAGIKFELKQLDASTIIKNVDERQFKIHYQSWGSILFPNPESMWRSDLADKKDNNNLNGYKNAKVDELLKKYDVTLDRAEQKKICREIDKLVYDEYPYALGWYANYDRILFWDKLGHPDSYVSKIGTFTPTDVIQLWWYDSERMKALDDAKKNGTTLEQGTVDVHPWDKK